VNADKNGKTSPRDSRLEAERKNIEAVWAFWQNDTGHTRSILDRKRARRIAERLKDFTVEELCEAIRNRRNDPWLMGTSKGSDGTVYDGILTLLRDVGQVERLRDLKQPVRAPQRGGPGPVQNSPRGYSGLDGAREVTE
jgi:hypothetical protein